MSFGSPATFGPTGTQLPAKRTPTVVYTDAPGVLYDIVTVLGRTQPMTGATVTLSVRPLESRTAVLSKPATVISPFDAQGHNVSYTWQSSDITALGEGDFMAWWTFTLPGAQAQDTPEFPLLVSDHGPGLGTQTGPIVDGVAAFMPVSLNALRNDARFGDKWLQQQANVVEIRTLGYTVDPNQESTLNPVVVDYLSKRLALGLTKPAIEFWSRQMRTSTSTQTSEVTSYPDMIATLKELKNELVMELKQEWRDLLLIVPGLPQRKVVPLPQSSIGGPNDPHCWEPNTRSPREMPELKTGGYGWGLAWGVWPFP